jgi:hypothetical protein
MAKKTCQLVKITLPGADAIGIIYPDNEILVFRGKKAVRLMPLPALIKMCSQGGVSRRLSAQHPLLDEAAKALGIKPKSPCRIKIDVITEDEESSLGRKLGNFAGVSIKRFDEGRVIPAIACRGDIYFRKGDRIVCLEDFLDCIRGGYIVASRLEPDFDWDGEDDSPSKISDYAKKKAALRAKKPAQAAAQVAEKVEEAVTVAKNDV